MVAYSFKQRFVAPIRIGLDLPIEPLIGLAVAAGTEIRPKRQTIRAIGKRRHTRPGETLQLYTAMRTKQCKKIGEARCTEVIPIVINVKEHSMPVRLDGKHIGVFTGLFGLREFAQMDGFESAEDMHAFWKAEHGLGEFSGVLIKWEPIQ